MTADNRGSVTVTDVLEATNSQEVRRRVELWSQAFWRAYGSSQLVEEQLTTEEL